MNSVDVLGLVAASLTSLSFLPQVIKTVRSRDTTSISLFMYSLFVTGVGCWLIWGIMVNQVPVIIANVVTLLLAAVILGMKLYAVFVKKEPI
ncbi:MAG: hypothetical protein RI964_2808 [Pseudomonadota bacterium]|jgi:MtN3 and saliva related transmembrane protein